MSRSYWIRNEKIHALDKIIDDIALNKEVDQELFEFAKRVIRELSDAGDNHLPFVLDEIHFVLTSADSMNEQLMDLAYIHKELTT